MTPEPTIKDVKKYILEALAGFDSDPPDTDYQSGYLDALITLGEELLRMPNISTATDPKPRQVTHLRLVHSREADDA